MTRKAVSKIAYYRQKKGFTQVELAAFIGVSPNTIQNWEKEDGEGIKQMEKYLRLCKLLGHNLEDLIDYVEVDEKTKHEGVDHNTLVDTVIQSKHE